MSVHAEKAPMTSGTTFEPATVNVRIKISALWTAMLFVFAYVDLFSLYRPDVRADLEAGQISVFTINQTFLLFITAYVAIPALMVFGTLVLRPAISRIANISAERPVRGDDRRRLDRRGELLLPARQRPRGRTARGRRLLRLDLAQDRLVDIDQPTRGQH